jgi:hypothetical protein
VKRFSADDTEGGIPWENMPLPEAFFIAFFRMSGSGVFEAVPL